MDGDPSPNCNPGERQEAGVKIEFGSSFLCSPAYLQWRDVGTRHGLRKDEEIACFLLRHYEDTSKVFLSDMTVCKICGACLSISCVQCNWTVQYKTTSSHQQQISSQSGGGVTVKEEAVDDGGGEGEESDSLSSMAVPIGKMVEAVSEKKRAQACHENDGVEGEESDDCKEAGTKREKKDCGIEENPGDRSDEAEPADDLEEGDEGNEELEDKKGENKENPIHTVNVSAPGGMRAAETGLVDHKCNKSSAVKCQVSGSSNSPSCNKAKRYAGQKPYVCDVCNKVFKHATTVKRHKMIHSGQRPFLCDICSKTFLRAAELKRHKLTHSDRNFKCDVCGKTFVRESYLKVHKMTHTGHTPFMCDVCGKGLTSLSNLYRHKLIHVGKKPFVCDVCDKSFFQASILKTHKRLHTDNKSFMCGVVHMVSTAYKDIISSKLKLKLKLKHMQQDV